MKQDMTHRIIKDMAQGLAMTARVVLTGLILLLTSVNAAAQVTVKGSVFGGGNLADVGGSVAVNMTAGTVVKDVYGGGALANTNNFNLNEYDEVTVVAGTKVKGYYTKDGDNYNLVEDEDETADGTTKYYKKGKWVTTLTSNTTTVNLLGGTINGDAYGGGLGQRADNSVTPAVTAVEAKVYGDVKIYLNGMDKSFYDAADATMQAIFDTRITKTGSTFYLVKTNTKGAVVKRVFGANNKNGSPKGNVTVHVFGTQHKSAENIRTKLKNANADLEKGSSQTDEQYITVLKGVLTDMITKAGILHITVTNDAGTGYQDICDNSSSADDIKKAINDLNDEINAKILDENTSTDDIDALFDRIYDVEAVYGGGNEAAYIPMTAYHPTNASSGSKTQVIIEGCDETSIEAVYGGGNAASVPETNVDIVSAHEIQTVFGGGNGKDATSYGANPGADVGVYKTGETETIYGTGNATTKLEGGYFHEAYGASNSKGNIKGNISINTVPTGICHLKYDKLVGAGKNADVDKDVIMILGCNPRTKNPLIFGGADNANVNGNVELTITSGTFGKVFGGNNLGGIIKGHIKVNIEETECNPIRIDELYLGGNQAAYSRYGYYKDGDVYKPRTAAMAAITDPDADGYQAAEEGNHNAPYEEPELNVISCTYIGKVFGGGYGERAVLHGNPTVNINMIAGRWASSELGAADKLGEIVDVFGGGNAAKVEGNTTVNIGTVTTVGMVTKPAYLAESAYSKNTTTGLYDVTVQGANITGNVYGGGNEADVTGNTFVNVCAVKSGTTYSVVAEGGKKVTIAGDVYGGGKGKDDSFTCEKAMVGTDGAGADQENYPDYSDGNTTVVIGNGTVNGNVYGGGEIGRVEMNTSVTVGLGDGVASDGTVTSAPEIKHNVFGGGKGLETHGYSALVRGNPTVIIQGNAKVRDNVYGGGQIASVARYKVAQSDDEGAPYGVKKDMPYALADPDHPSGVCTVTVQGYAEIGPATFTEETKTTDVGHVFGAGKGIVPGPGGAYAFVQNTTKRMVLNADKTASIWENFASEADYITFVKTLALASQTNVTIDGNAKVKGSVFGGSESGFVQFDTNVTVAGGTIGTQDKGGADFGNVYGGGKGDAVHTGVDVTYVDAGLVKGNTKVIIEDGTILHNVYGGGAYGTVGEFVYNESGIPTGRRTYTVGTTVHQTTGGKAEIYITGGTIGTTGKENGMIFGSSRGDVGAPNSIHDKLAWVYDTHVAVGDTTVTTTATTTPLIKGSVYGGGENGHNLHNAYVRINGGTIGIAEGEPITTNDNGTPDDITDDTSYSGAAYPYRGNVYGGGCGTDMYKFDSDNDGEVDDDDAEAYNPLAGIVQGNAIIHITAGNVIHNVYGAGAMGSVGKMNTTGAITSGGTTTIEISGGTVGVSGTVDDGNVFGAARGDETAPKGLAQVKTTNVTISGTATGTIIKGNVYGGGQLGDVGTYTYDNTTKTYTWDKIGTVETGDCNIIVNGGTIEGYVYGAGKGIANTFECEKALVRKTDVSINAGTVNHNVYGGGEIGRVDQDTKVTLGGETGTSGGEDAIIGGEVFGAGAGLETHGYSALVRGNAEVIVQGNATVGGSVYGGGEIAAVGRYRLDDNEMPTALVSGGECKVTVKGYAVIGSSGTGDVFGAGKGVNPSDATHTYIDFTSTDKDELPKRMTLYTNATDFPADATGTPTATPNGSTWDYCKAGSPYVWEYYTSQASYFKFLQSLALATDTKVSIEGNATVNGNVYGGSESGFVQRDTDVEIKGGAIGSTGSTTDGNIFGGGKGLDVFAEAGRVRGNATVAISGGNIAANVYGGGELGHVGSFTETTDGRFDMVKIKDKEGEDMDTGLCTVTITGGKVGSDTNTDSKKGNVFGAGKGKDDTFKCEKAMVLNTSVSINTGAVNGDVFGGGEIGRVEYNSQVTMGSGSVKRSIYGGGAGIETHGYSALVRGNTTVTIEGGSVGESVYGGGEIASVGRYGLDAQKMPSILLGGGYCYVTVKGSATIGSATEAGDVFGAGKGVVPHFDKDNAVKANRSRRMTVYNADEFPESAKISTTSTATAYEGSIWEYYDESVTPKLVWEYFQDETKYNDYLETLALATHPEVNIDGNAHVYGSVFGGGELGITKGSVFVNILGGTIEEDVYGGGSLANTNTTSSVGLKNTDETPQYEEDGKTIKTTTVHPKTKVNLLGGHIKGDAYGGGLGQLNLPASDTQPAVPAIEAKVYGDVKVNLNGLQSADDINATTLTSLTSGGKLEADGTAYQVKSTVKGCAVTRIFGCNNLNGSPQKKVQVYVYGTQSATTGVTQIANAGTVTNAKVKGRYDVAAVYGGGNLSPYVPEDALLPYTDANKAKVDAARPEVYIDGCDRTSIQQVYGGGNAASAPATFVQVNRCFEIDEVFGGGNGFDNYSLNEHGEAVWYENPGANVGYYTYATHPKGTGQGSGTETDPYKAVEDTRYAGGAENKTARLAATDIQYGSGIATLEVKGGTIHTSYGGSNSKGNVRALLSSVYSAAFDDCPMAVDKSYGGGKNAYSDADSDMKADCAKGVKTMFGGSENADFDGNVNMLITNGSSLEKVFGGNNTSGAVNGSITITLEEGGCEPIHIDELYLGGFLAPYSVYGYETNTDGSYKTENVDYVDTDGTTKTRSQRIPKTSGTRLYADPRINVISATYIGDIFGGGYQAKLVGNPHINVNMTTGFVKVTKDGDVYKDVAGNTYDPDKVSAPDPEKPTELIAITDIGTIGNIYGGGNMADIVGDTYVEIGTGTEHNAAGTALVPIVSGRNAANITGNVFGGGKGKADSFKCAKAMVGVEDSGSGSTNVIIGNGTVEGTVYGGGEIGRVEANTNVTIGLEDGTGEPVIKGNVFGAGRGVHTHGYAALVRGNATVTVQGEAKVRKSVYGGGEIASVGKYNIATKAYHDEHPEVLEGMPYSLVSDNKGICNVIVRGNAVIGPEGSMEMKATGGPDDTGHVFGAGRGVLPYHDIDGNIITGDPWRMKPGDNEHPTGIVETFNETTFSEAYYTELYGSDYNKKLYNYLADYLRFIETLALTTQTEVTIGGKAFVKGSVYGGSENGHVQHDTHVTIQDYCQIGHSAGVSTRFTEDEWDSADPAVLKECASWDYVATEGAPYDPLAKSDGTYDYADYQFVPEADRSSRPTSEGGKPTATDGHTYYGNVFGGGSGVIPYAPGRWHREAGSVGGNTQVDITGGHIMTSVYGGNEQTDVGTYVLDPDNDYQPTIPKSGGKCTVNMTGGTVGVPRTEDDMKAHPVTCYLFGAGKGDQRIFFNTWTNVINTEVNISGEARIYGSTFGGGEDGHVINNAVTNISGDEEKVIIGTTGTSYVDGNVFGGGRGFSGEAQTAGTVGGNVEVNIEGGTILGSVYGGGRLASVGTLFTAPTDPNYGNFVEDEGDNKYGYITVNISGGTIGNGTGRALIPDEDGKIVSGNVFGGSMGRLTLLNGTTNPIWPRMAQVKNTTVTVSGGTVKRTVFGGGELGTVRDNATVNITGGIVGRDVYGAGYGSDDHTTKTLITVKEPKEGVTNPSSASDYKDVSYVFTPMIFAGCVGKNTYVNVSGGHVKKSVYGGGEMASAGIIDCRVEKDNSAKNPIYTEGTDKYVYISNHKHDNPNNDFVLSWPYHFENVPGYFGATHVNVTGGRIGLNGEENKDENNPFEDKDNGDVVGGSKGIAGDFNDYVFCANVGSTEVTIDLESTADPAHYMDNDNISCIAGAVYGGAENGHVMGDTKVTLKKGLIGHSVYGGGSGKGKFSTKLLKIGKKEETATDADYYTRDIYSITAGKVFGNTEVIMEDGYVVRNVYGGGNMGSVGKGNYAGGPDDYSTAGYGEKVKDYNLWDKSNSYGEAFLKSGKSKVTILGGTVGYINPANPSESVYGGLPYGNVFGGCRGEAAPNISESPRYLYSPEFFVGYVNETDVTIGTVGKDGPKILGSVYGGGMDGHVRRDTKVTINSGEIGSVNGGLDNGNVYGAGSGIGKYKYDFNYDGKYTSTVEYAGKQTKEEDYSTSAGSVTRFTTVDIKGGTIHRNVYGGGSLSSVGAPRIGQDYDPYHPEDSEHSGEAGKLSLNKVTISGGQIGDAEGIAAGYGGDVNGGSRGETSFENSLMSPSSFASSVWADVTIKDDANILGNVFGGGEAGMVKHDTEVKMQGGTVGNDLYGGGDMADVNGNTTVSLTGGTIKHDAYGAARGTTDIPAVVGGNATLTLDGTKFIPVYDTDKYKTPISGRVFGANNVNGTPKGHVKVHVLRTVDSEKKPTVALEERTTYDVAAVYGGGNNADYRPTSTDEYAEVIIEGCNLTSIRDVYGGGNAAATPANEVQVAGCYIIDNVFGGGNGTVKAANVGYNEADDPETTDVNETYKTLGTAKTNLSGGYIHNVFGGSNKDGNILGGTFLTNDSYTETGANCCDEIHIQELYGGGNEAIMEGGAEIVLRCMPDSWIGEVYAGARNATVGNDVSLTITSGKFEHVFGGNKSGGQIEGYVEVNIEECPTCNTPVIIGELYGGGNEAEYTYSHLDTNPDYPSPRVNVRAFTSIGTIYGGGKGEAAVVNGNPTVYVSVGMVDGGGQDYSGETRIIDEKSVQLYDHKKGKIGVIGNVFGGGNAAEVNGNTNVFIGTEKFVKLDRIVAGETDVSNYYIRTGTSSNYQYDPVPRTKATVAGTYYQRNQIGTYTPVDVLAGADVSGYYTRSGEEGSYVYTPVSAAEEGKVYCLRVEGVDIRGNVYGGGNAAKVTGNTNVVVGKKTEE